MGNDVRIREYIADQFFEGWMDAWYDPEEDDVKTKLGFQRQLSLSGFHAYWSDATVLLYYNDGNLFGGHSIELGTDLKGTFEEHGPSIVG